jgi:hypothetical protein
MIGSIVFNPKINNAFGYTGPGIQSFYRGNGTNMLGNLTFKINNDSEAMRIDENGNIGIGTTTPTARLHVAGSARIVDGTQATNRVLTSDANGLASWQPLSGNTTMPAYYDWLKSGSAQPTSPADSAGNVYHMGSVCIGLPTPITTFDAAQVSIQTTSSIGLHIRSSHTDHNGLLVLEKEDVATVNDQFVFFKAGGANIGNIIATGASGVAYNTTSDIRLKENIRTTDFGIADVMKIHVRDYNYKRDKNSPQTGFIAQQLYTVFPIAVTKGGEDVSKPWMVDYSKVVPLLTKAIQDQQAEIEALKIANASLKAEVNKISQLSGELNMLKASIEKLTPPAANQKLVSIK